MILENTNMITTPWRKVTKPTPKPGRTVSRIVSKPPAPPVSPKPGGKVYLYVYDNEPEVPYPHEKDKREREEKQKQAASQHGRTGRERVRNQGRKSDRAYRVLAEVTPNLRASSRGGRMFVKQRQRMDQFTKESQKQSEEENQNQFARNDFVEGVTDGWATPWNLATKSPAAVQYITSKRLAGNADKTKRLKDPLGFMPRPPDFWRAKVEQNFPNGPIAPLQMRSRTIGRHRSGWNPSAEIDERPDSAPPMESPSHENDGEYNQSMIYNDNKAYSSESKGDYSRYGIPPRPASAALPSATIHFDAKRYYTTPDRQQGIIQGYNAFTTTPYAHRDFNARPKGWQREY